MPILVQEILLLQTVGGSGSILGMYYCRFIVFLHTSLYLLLKAAVSERVFEWAWTFGACSVQLFLCCKACSPFFFYLFSRILSTSSTQTLPQNGVLTHSGGVLGPLVVYPSLCVTFCVPPKSKISMKQEWCSGQGQDCRYLLVGSFISDDFVVSLLHSTFLVM